MPFKFGSVGHQIHESNGESHRQHFSQESKQMIHEVGNIELCELLDTEPNARCKVCLSYWDVGIVNCTCGHFFRNGTEENKKFVQYTMDLLLIPNYCIKKGRPHEKKPGDREYYITNSLKKNAKSSTWMSTTGSNETRSSARTCLTPVALKKVSQDGQIGGRRPHAPLNSRRNSRLQS